MNGPQGYWSLAAGLLSIGMVLIQSQAGKMDQPGSQQTISVAGIQGPVRILDDSFDPRFPSAMNAGIPSSFGPVSALNPLESVSIQPDGRIVVGGRLSSDTGAFLGLARLNPDGEVDATFQPGTALGSVNAHAMDDSGNIYAHTFFENGERGLVKLNSTGAVMWTMPIEKPSTWFYEESAVLVRQNGSILLGGSFTGVGGAKRKSLVAVESNGTIEDAFNLDINGAVYALAEQPDGKVLLGGMFTTINGISRARVARLNSDGSLDSSFDPGNALGAEVFAMAVQSDGKILLSGNFNRGNGSAGNRLLRLNSNGSLDDTFAKPDLDESAYKIVLDQEQRIVIAGTFNKVGGQTRHRLARLNSDGSLDLTYDPGLGPNERVRDLAIDKNGSYVLAGYFTKIDRRSRHGVARVFSQSNNRTVDFADEEFFAEEKYREAVLQLQRYGDATGEMIVHVASEPGDAPHLHEFSAFSAEVRFASGELQKTVIIPFPDDGEVEGRESVPVKCWVEGEEHPRSAVFTVLDDEEPVITMGRIATPPFYNVAGTVAIKGNRLAVGGWVYTNAVPGASEPFFGVVTGEYGQPSTFRKVFDATGFDRIPILLWTEENKLLITAVNGNPPDEMVVLNEDGSTNSDVTTAQDALLRGEKFQSHGKRIALVQSVLTSALVRRLPDGLPDDSFLSPTNSVIDHFFVLPDDKILIGGPFQTIHGIYRPGVARLNADGTVDLSFNPERNGTGGVFPRADGRVLVRSAFVSGWSLLNSDGSLNHQLVLESDGSIIPAVALDDGRVITSDLRIIPAFNADLSSVTLEARAISLEEGSARNLRAHRIGNISRAETVPFTLELLKGEDNGDLILPARTISFEAMQRDSIITIQASSDSIMETDELYRLTPGTPDGVLVSDVFVEINIIDHNSRPGAATTIAEFDTNYVLAGTSGGGSVLLAGSSRSLAIFNPIDRSISKIQLPLDEDRFVSLVAPFGQGYLVGGAFYGTTNEPMGGLVRLNADGTVDSSFSSRALPLMPENLRVRADGGLIVTGNRLYAPEGFLGNVALLSSNGIVERALQVPPSINATAVPLTDNEVLYHYQYYDLSGSSLNPPLLTGIRLYDIATRKDAARFKPAAVKGYVFSIVPTPQGILVAGQFESINGVPRRDLARLLFNGELDLSFNPALEPVSNIEPTLDSKGGILLSGYLNNVNGVLRAGLARLHSDGSLDLAFDPGTSLNQGETRGFISSIVQMENGNFFALETFFNSDLPVRAISIPLESPLRASIKSAESTATIQLEFMVTPGTSYQIESSSDLIDWATLTTTNSSGYQLRLELPKQAAQQFFRAKD